MLDLRRSLIDRHLAALCFILLVVFGGCRPLFAFQSVGESPAVPGSADGDHSIVNIFVGTPSDVPTLWKALQKPDFVLLKGIEYDRIRQRDRFDATRVSNTPRTPVVQSVGVRGRLNPDVAEITVDLHILAESDHPFWVPVRLDGQALMAAREGDRDLQVRVDPTGRWEALIQGQGRHHCSIDLVLLVRSTAEGRRIELAIPEAPSTSISLDVSQKVILAQSGPGETIKPRTQPNTPITRLQAELPPRAKLTLLWQVEEETANVLPPLLVAKGEIAIEVDPGAFRTRSSWAIRSLRGSSRVLQMRLDPLDEVREVELDGQSPPVGIEREGETTTMTVPLTEPLGPGQERRLVLNTSRVIPVGSATRIAFNGFPLTDSKEQSGAIGISRGSQLWVSADAGRGLRQLDPRTELPAELRSRPGTELAFQFSDQPFELNLKTEPSPPLVTAQSRTTISLEADKASIETWLDYQQTRGKPLELRLSIPNEIEIESVGPDELVSSWQTDQRPETSTATNPSSKNRYLTIRVTPRVQDGGRFTLRIAGRQGFKPSPTSSIGLIQPVGAISVGGRIAVVADSRVTVELNEKRHPLDAELGPFRPATQSLNADWPWPEGRAPTGPPALSLRFDGVPDSLPLSVSINPSRINRSTSLLIKLDRLGADVQEDIDCEIRSGTINRIDISIPNILGNRWTLENPLGATRSELRADAEGRKIVRVSFPTGLTRSSRLRFRFRIPFMESKGSGDSTRLSIPWIRLEESTETESPIRATVIAATEITPTLVDPNWSLVEDLANDSNAQANRLSCSSSETHLNELMLQIDKAELAALPRVVVPRTLLRGIQTSDGKRLITATFAVETVEPWFKVRIPDGLELMSVRVDRDPIRQAVRQSHGLLRVSLGSRSSANARIVEIECLARGARSGSAWAAPRAEEPTVTQQTYWEIMVPQGQTIVGAPSEWSDENQWLLSAMGFRRSSLVGNEELNEWIHGRSLGASPSPLPNGESQRLLFGSPVGGSVLELWIVPRALLVALCSGVVLISGAVLLLVWKPSPIYVVLLAAATALAATLARPSDLGLLAQSSFPGVALTAVVAWMHHRLEKRQALATIPNAQQKPGTSPIPLESTPLVTVEVGSDDSTAIRSKPISTVDFAHKKSLFMDEDRIKRDSQIAERADDANALGEGNP